VEIELIAPDAGTDEAAPVVALAAAVELGPARVGWKAFNLARLAAMGSPVPSGFVVTPAARAAWDLAEPALASAAAELGGKVFAVRSSGVAEDLGGASYAGMYETLLNIAPADLAAAVKQVSGSAGAERARAYRRTHGRAARPAPAPIAVLVQVMVEAEAAGVAFSADPISGDREGAVVVAVRGLGERLVTGEAVGDEWVVRGAEARCRRSREQAIDAAQARQIAMLARSAEAQLGAPQDIEWAISGGKLFLLQARPITALPEPTSWAPPHPSWWLRNFRLGEWLPEPLTPLFADWLLPVLERGFARAMSAQVGIDLRTERAIVNGWYYTTPQPHADGPVALQLLRHPRVLLRLPKIALLVLHPERTPRTLARMTCEWREQLLPRYHRTVEAADATATTTAPPAELVRLIEQLADLAGEYAWSVATLAGSEWKIEAALGRFCRKHLSRLEQSPQLLVSGLAGSEPELPAHAVHSIDWYWPTAGELDTPAPAADVARGHRQLAARRKTAEAACRAALAHRRRLRRRFDRLLAIAQTYAVVREQQTRQLTLGWPILRRCALQLGDHLARHDRIGEAEDVFFLVRAELEAALAGQPLPPRAIDERNARWQRQRRLAAPLELGNAPAAARRIVNRAIEASRNRTSETDPTLVGEPASPGRASGPIHIILDPADFATFRPGEVLVARATAPAWTPLFAKAAAVVTDGGTLAAHASLIAREYGIPAVVATGDATSRLHDGQTVTVDGSGGIVQLHP
jgi:rifampicin phosphotransferase